MTAVWEMVVGFITGAFGAMTSIITSVGTDNVLAMWLIAIPIFGLVFGIVKGILPPVAAVAAAGAKVLDLVTVEINSDDYRGYNRGNRYRPARQCLISPAAYAGILMHPLY